MVVRVQERTGGCEAVRAWLAAQRCGGWRFSSPVDGLQLVGRSSQTACVYWNGAWELGVVRANAVKIGGVQVVGSRQPAIAEATGETVIDSQARAAIAQFSKRSRPMA